ncbi:hypothetical protein C8F01DRAFT_1303061 [Mycena amicta]|nr:hypothetical protein C8F01DRAFT_1303061 [Mycena amicta]
MARVQNAAPSPWKAKHPPPPPPRLPAPYLRRTPPPELPAKPKRRKNYQELPKVSLYGLDKLKDDKNKKGARRWAERAFREARFIQIKDYLLLAVATNKPYARNEKYPLLRISLENVDKVVVVCNKDGIMRDVSGLLFGECRRGIIFRNLLEFAKAVDLSAVPHARSMNTYRAMEGCVEECFHLVEFWHPIGHPVRGSVSLLFQTDLPSQGHHASDVIKTSYTMEAATQLSINIQPLSHVMNTMFKVIDPAWTEATRELKETALKRLPCDIFSKSVRTPGKGREIIYNRESEDHTDSADPFFSWAELKAIAYNERCAVFCQGRALVHSVDEWFDVQRIAIPHFTHESAWSFFHKTPPKPIPAKRKYVWVNDGYKVMKGSWNDGFWEDDGWDGMGMAGTEGKEQMQLPRRGGRRPGTR